MPISQSRALHRNQRILDVALRVFSERGYGRAKVDEIADRARTSKGGVYFHFPSKQAIFLALLDRTRRRLLKKIEEAIASESDPIAKADAALLAVLHTFASHRALARLFLIESMGAGHEFHQRMLEMHEEFIDVVKTHLDDAIEQGAIPRVDTDIAARVWFGALNQVTTSWILAKRPTRLEDAHDELRTILLRSVGAVDHRERNVEAR